MKSWPRQAIAIVAASPTGDQGNRQQARICRWPDETKSKSRGLFCGEFAGKSHHDVPSTVFSPAANSIHPAAMAIYRFCSKGMIILNIHPIRDKCRSLTIRDTALFILSKTTTRTCSGFYMIQGNEQFTNSSEGYFLCLVSAVSVV